MKKHSSKMLSSGELCSLGVVCLIFAICTAFVPAFAQQSSDPVPPGQVAEVICASDASQSYALYLPSAYTSGKRWPIVYLFDPGGRGRFPVDLYKVVAESYGFILAGSNNSRNYSGDQSKAVNAIWQDTHARLAIDEHRSYSSGFSGGARVAGAMALSGPPGRIAGVIAHGAGYPGGTAAARDDLLYFFAVGDQDFNWPEVVNIRRDREERGLPYRVRVFAGRHQWAPPTVMEEALQYLNLKAMQSENLTRDPGFIDRVFEKILAEAAEAERRKDEIAELNAYGSLVADFNGLRDTKEPAAKLAALQQSPALKSALKREHEEMSAQMKLEQEIAQKIDAVANNSAPDSTGLRQDIRQQIGALIEDARHSKSETRRLIAGRAWGGIFVRTMENGEQELAARHFEKAEAYFDLMRLVSDDPWPVLSLAETHALSGNRKLAIKDVREAVRRGLNDRAALEKDSQLESLKTDPEFQKLLDSLGSK